MSTKGPHLAAAAPSPSLLTRVCRRTGVPAALGDSRAPILPTRPGTRYALQLLEPRRCSLRNACWCLGSNANPLVTLAVETLLEQWVFHYQPSIMPQGPSLSRSQLSRLNPTSIYKRLIIMLRSLFCYVRVLPAYRMFRVCKVRQATARVTRLGIARRTHLRRLEAPAQITSHRAPLQRSPASSSDALMWQPACCCGCLWTHKACHGVPKAGLHTSPNADFFPNAAPAREQLHHWLPGVRDSP
jgi:hypothetical protein